MFFNKLVFIIVLFFIPILSYAQIVNNTTELNNAIAAAAPGTTIILAAGTWNDVFIDIDKNGNSSDPITIIGQKPGAVLMTGNSRVYMSGSYLTVSGLVFQNPANLVTTSTKIEPVFELEECDHCKVINNKIDTYNGTESQKTLKFKWVLLDDCQHNEIAYNSFVGKYGIGSIINDNRQLANPDYLKIHHNYFADRTPINAWGDDNDQDAIRIGTSTTSLSNSFSEVYDNYFYNFFGEIEVISNKSGQNKYYNNTFRDYSGTLTLRHGDSCEVFGNYFFPENNPSSGGIRVIGEAHKVYNNYIEGVNSFKANGANSNSTGGINVTNGRLNSALNGYFQVIDAQIVNNTFVNCDYGLRIGTMVKSDLDQEPINLTVANNIMYNTSIDPYQIITQSSGNSISEGNLTNVSNSDLIDDGNFHRLVGGSSPIDAGIGSYSFLTQDVLGGNRDANFDAGAEEFGATGTHFPYESADVGTTIGFGTDVPLIKLSAKAFLQGPYSAGRTMSDGLRSNGLIPTTEPYTALGFTPINGGGEITTTDVLAVTGNDAIVDWIFLELRDKNDATNIIHTRSALIQKDGDIVDVDGSSPVTFSAAVGDDYFVAVRHRNHLGVMGLNSLALSTMAASIDFSSVATYGINSQADLGSGTMGMHAADLDHSNTINSSDRIEAWSSRNLSGYRLSDATLDGNTNAADRIMTWNNRNLNAHLP